MAELANFDNIKFTGPGVIPRALNAPITATITIQGDVAVAEHWYANAIFFGPAVYGVVDYTTNLLAALAREIHRPNIDTQATFNSITPTEQGTQVAGSLIFGEVGPETPQAVFQEYGFTSRGGRFIKNPFMIPAAEAIAPLFVSAIAQIVEVASDRRLFTDEIAAKSSAAQELTNIRGLLYSYSKFAGDLKVIGISGPGLTASRGLALKAARATGDLSSLMRASIGTRIFTRVAGRFASGGIRAQLSANVSGPSASYQAAATRLYNRVVGRAAGEELGLLK